METPLGGVLEEAGEFLRAGNSSLEDVFRVFIAPALRRASAPGVCHAKRTFPIFFRVFWIAFFITY